MGSASVRRGEQGAELKGKALDLPVDLRSYPHLRSLWVVTERMRSRVQAGEMSFLRRVAGLSLRDRGRSAAIREEFSGI